MGIFTYRSFWQKVSYNCRKSYILKTYSDNYSLFWSLILTIYLNRFEVDTHMGICPELFF